jgi:hypothetical protein
MDNRLGGDSKIDCRSSSRSVGGRWCCTLARIDRIERAVQAVNDQVQASERKGAQGLEAMGREVLKIAQNLNAQSKWIFGVQVRDRFLPGLHAGGLTVPWRDGGGNAITHPPGVP